MVQQVCVSASSCENCRRWFSSGSPSPTAFHYLLTSNHSLWWGQVYVSASKLRVLQALGLPPEYQRLLTTSDKVGKMHPVPDPKPVKQALASSSWAIVRGAGCRVAVEGMRGEGRCVCVAGQQPSLNVKKP